jgi:hypothetical protein
MPTLTPALLHARRQEWVYPHLDFSVPSADTGVFSQADDFLIFLILIPFFLASRLPFIPLIRFENKTVSTDAFFSSVAAMLSCFLRFTFELLLLALVTFSSWLDRV